MLHNQTLHIWPEWLHWRWGLSILNNRLIGVGGLTGQVQGLGQIGKINTRFRQDSVWDGLWRPLRIWPENVSLGRNNLSQNVISSSRWIDPSQEFFIIRASVTSRINRDNFLGPSCEAPWQLITSILDLLLKQVSKKLHIPFQFRLKHLRTLWILLKKLSRFMGEAH